MNKKYIIIASCALLVIGGYIYYSNNPKIEYKTVEVVRKNIVKNIVVPGFIKAKNLTNINSQIKGKISKIYVTLGQEVKNGDVLVAIQDDVQTNDIAIKNINIDNLRKKLEHCEREKHNAELSLENGKTLYEKQFISKKELRDLEIEYSKKCHEFLETQSNIEVATLELDTKRKNLQLTKLTSPISGNVVSILANEGQVVEYENTILTVADINTVECIIKISECDVDSLKIGMPILLNTFNNNNKYNATLESIDFVPSSFSDNKDNKVEKQGSVYYYGHFTLPNENRSLRIGMTTTNTIQLASVDNVLVVPINTLQQDEDKIYVKVLENGEVVNHDVVVGIKNVLEAEIQSGVNENDKVIVD